MGGVRTAAAVLCAGLMVAPAARAEDACNGEVQAITGARTPEVDLYSAPSGGELVRTIPKGEFPSCLAVAEVGPSQMLGIDMDGTRVWIPAYMVRKNFSPLAKPVCRRYAENAAPKGGARGLGEGCGQANREAPQ